MNVDKMKELAKIGDMNPGDYRIFIRGSKYANSLNTQLFLAISYTIEQDQKLVSFIRYIDGKYKTIHKKDAEYVAYVIDFDKGPLTMLTRVVMMKNGTEYADTVRVHYYVYEDKATKENWEAKFNYTMRHKL